MEEINPSYYTALVIIYVKIMQHVQILALLVMLEIILIILANALSIITMK